MLCPVAAKLPSPPSSSPEMWGQFVGFDLLRRELGWDKATSQSLQPLAQLPSWVEVAGLCLCSRGPQHWMAVSPVPLLTCSSDQVSQKT